MPTRRISLRQAKKSIKHYNEGTYKRVNKLNIEVDSLMYNMFSQGLGRTKQGIEKQLLFIGNDYGGVAGFPSALELVPKLAAKIIENRSQIERLVCTAPPLVDKPISKTSVDQLYPIFVEPIHKKRNWQIWASKFWHALNPHAFPIEDSRADDFFLLKSMRNSPAKQFRFYSAAREFALWVDSRGWLPELRKVDEGRSWSDLKLIDKILYSYEAKEATRN